MLEVSSLSFKRGGLSVLDGVHMRARAGEITAVLGPNGAGKTTLLKCLNGIFTPEKGEVKIVGRPLSELSLRAVAQKVAYVAQHSPMFSMTAFDAILMGRLPHMGARPKGEDLAKVEEVMGQLHLAPLRLALVSEMSGGQRQKVSIARALVQETPWILMDEPTSSLDLKNQMETLALMREIVRRNQKGVVVTLHDLNAALGYADRCFFLHKGRIHWSGTSKEVTPEVVSAVYGVKVEIVYHKGRPLVIPLTPGVAA